MDSRLARSDGRLGAPAPTGPVLDHLCPICDGESSDPFCFCDGRGIITAAQAAELAADDPDPRWQPRPLPVVPAYTGRRCGDCAFKAGSGERDGMTAAQLFDHLALGSDGAPFFCHAGMHVDGRDRYVPRQRDAGGVPVGHPICAGWVREYERRASAAERQR